MVHHTDTKRLKDISNTFNLIQEIDFPTHKAGNVLDWINKRSNNHCIQKLTKLEFLSDHCNIEWTMHKVPSIQEKMEKNRQEI